MKLEDVYVVVLLCADVVMFVLAFGLAQVEIL
jgi:hypothetical protein